MLSARGGKHTSGEHREEWEEDLTSTQNLALSGSALKKKVTYVEPTVKLNNFVAPDA